ncbi:MAG: hypothetical protein GIX03_07210 [Candidatus Eremiobacteraeota bacterium]|nr:hypothetical protein [Candidatus Eremiobacteraeota bacterium]
MRNRYQILRAEFLNLGIGKRDNRHVVGDSQRQHLEIGAKTNKERRRGVRQHRRLDEFSEALEHLVERTALELRKRRRLSFAVPIWLGDERVDKALQRHLVLGPGIRRDPLADEFVKSWPCVRGRGDPVPFWSLKEIETGFDPP